MAGRKPVPSKLRLIRGADKSKINKLEPEAPGALVEGPPYLTENQRTIWNYAIENAPKGVLRRIDREALAKWVVAEDLYQTALAKVLATGLIVKSPKGYPMNNPYLGIMNRQGVMLVRLMGELGFSPSARARLVSGEGQPVDMTWEKLASG